MAKLTKYELVHTEGIHSVSYEGVNYRLEDIDDKAADLLFGRTHVLIKKPVAPVAVPKPPKP